MCFIVSCICKWIQYLVLLLCEALSFKLNFFFLFFFFNDFLQYDKPDPLSPDKDEWK